MQLVDINVDFVNVRLSNPKLPIMKQPLNIILLACLWAGTALSTPFNNPIVDPGADPWILQKDGYYYYMHTAGNEVQIRRTRKITGASGLAAAGASYTFYPPAPYNQEVWAPEIHFLQGKWYLYYAADDGNNNNHRMFVAEATDPLGPYTNVVKITDSTDRWAIDGTVLVKSDGSLYFVWSGWAGATSGDQNIYIAPMSDPKTISGPRVNLSTTSYSWEKVNGSTPMINEGPEILKRNGKTCIVYSANGAWTDNYCLGFFANTDGNYLNAASWTKNASSIFQTYVGGDGSVYAPGHCSFTTSVDGTEDWIVYHAALYQGAGWYRNVRAQRFTWNANDTPNFGHPIPTGVTLTAPSGEDIAEENAVMRSDGRLAALGVFTDTTIKVNNQVSSNGAYAGWGGIGGSGFRKISTVCYPDNRLATFGVGNSPVWVNTETSPGGTWSGWGLGDGPSFTSVKAAIRSDGKLSVAAVGDGTAVWVRNQAVSNGTWNAWSSLTGSGFWNIDLLRWPSNQLVVFGVGTGHVWVNAQTVAGEGNWSGWGEFQDGPSFNYVRALLKSDNSIVLVACGSGTGIWIKYQNGYQGSWTSWTNLGGSGFSRVDPVLRPDGTLVVFATGDSSSIWVNAQSSPGQGNWGGWSDMGGSGFGTVDGISYPDGRLSVFSHNYGTVEWNRVQSTPNGAWGSYTNLGTNTLR